MKVSARSLISFALFVVFYTALKGGYYFLNNRLQEIGILFTLILFIYSSGLAALNVKKEKISWSLWFFTPVIFLSYVMIIPAYLFSNHAGVNMISSVAASREFMIILIAPTVYFLFRIGYKLEDIEKVFSITISTLIFSYLFHYLRLDLVATYFHPNPSIAGMVTYDDWRGYRLKPPGMALTFGTLLAPILIFKSNTRLAKVIWILTFLASVYSWYLIKARSAIGAMLLGIILYHAWFAYKNRLGLFFIGLIIMIFMYASFLPGYFEAMQHEGGGVRYKSYTIAFEQISNFPLLGFGMQSNQTISEQELFWYKFYATDLGIIGIMFRYGIIGAVLYLSLLIYVVSRAVRANWYHRKAKGTANFFLIVAISRITGDLVRFILSVNYIFIDGLLIASLALAFSCAYKELYHHSPATRIS